MSDKVLRDVLEKGDVIYMNEMRLRFLYVSSKKKIGMHKYYLSRDDIWK